jgi:hypothetical protein
MSCFVPILDSVCDLYIFHAFTIFDQVQDGGKFCDICEVIMGIIDVQVTMNKSSKAVNTSVFTICQLFSHDVMIAVSDITYAML